MRKVQTPPAVHNILGLDVGGVRIGVAIASSLVRLPKSLTVIANNDAVWETLEHVIKTENIKQLVVGLPRGLSGQETGQTKVARRFATELASRFDIPVSLQDEALTSAQAEKELAKSGKKFDRGAIDSLAATYILEDFLREGLK